MVENGVLNVILLEHKRRFSSPKISKEIGRILGNLALEDATGFQIVDQGMFFVYNSKFQRFISTTSIQRREHPAPLASHTKQDFVWGVYI